MYIAELHVDGFGALERFNIEGLTPGLQVIYGYNEAGKSTLLTFIRALLFGFPDRRGRGNLYEPMSGRHGGRLVLVSLGERCVVERHAGKNGLRLLRPDGSAGTDAELQGLLGHASRDLYQNVFAFGLGELQTLDSLASEEVRGRIYTAGVGGGGAPLAAVEAQIEREMGELWSPRGQSTELARRFAQVEEIDEKLRALAGNAAEYDARVRELEAVRAAVSDADARLRDLRREQSRLKALEAAFPAWAELRDCEDRLAALPRVVEFPEDGLERLQRLEPAREAAAANAREAARRVLEMRERLGALQSPGDDALIGHAELVEILRRGRGDYDSKAQSLPKRAAELEAATAALASTLRELGPGWTEERLTALDTSVPVRDEVRSWKERLSAREEEARAAERRGEDAREQADAAAAAAVEAERVLGETPRTAAPGSPERQRIEAQRTQARRLRELAGARREAEVQREAAERAVEDLRAQVEATALEKPASLPRWPLFALAASAALAMFGAGVAAALGRSWPVLAMAAFLLAGTGVFYGEMRRRMARAGSGGRAALVQKARARLGEEEERLRAALARSTELRAQLSRPCHALGVAAEMDAGGLDRLEAEIDAEEKRLDAAEQAWQERRREAAASRAAAALSAERRGAAERAAAEARGEAAAAAAGWVEARARRGLGESLTPDGALELLSRAEAARTALASIHALRDRIAKIEAGMRAYEERARALLAACGEAVPAGAGRAAAAQVDALIEALEAARRRAQERESLARAVREAEEERVRHDQELARSSEELGALLQLGRAADPDAFRRKARAAVERRALQDRLHSHRVTLAGLAGGGEALDGLLDELGRSSRDRVRERLEEVEVEVDALEKERGARAGAAGALEQAVRELETDGRAAVLRADLAVEREALARGARRWAEMAVARALIRRAREEFERNRQPEVIQEASRFFARITEGRYRRIIAPPGESRHEVEEFATGQRRDSALLSRGTQEQLYLALRFGLIREVARRSEPLPVVMDDILVNFDPRRARAAAEALGDLAESHQVLLFTCHPQTVALVKEACPEAVERVLGGPAPDAPAQPEPPLPLVEVEGDALA